MFVQSVNSDMFCLKKKKKKKKNYLWDLHEDNPKAKALSIERGK
jgi:hypothetical protein